VGERDGEQMEKTKEGRPFVHLATLYIGSKIQVQSKKFDQNTRRAETGLLGQPRSETGFPGARESAKVEREAQRSTLE